MNRVKLGLAAALAIAAAGCSTPAPTMQHQATQPVAKAANRSVLADGHMSFAQLAKALPQRLTNEQAKSQLVSLPADKIKGALPLKGRKTQYFSSYSYYPYGNYYYPYYYYNNYWYPYSYSSYGSYSYPYYYYNSYDYYPYSYDSDDSYWNSWWY